MRWASVASPKSAVAIEDDTVVVDAAAGLLAEGIELFAATDHDVVTDLQPLIDTLGMTEQVRSITW